MAVSQTTNMQIDIDLLGAFEVRLDGRALAADTWKLRHPRQLLQMLALQPGRRMRRDQVCEYLWPDASLEAADNRLHHSIHVLRNALARAGVPKGSPLLTLQTDDVLLNPALRFVIDVARFDKLVEEARTQPLRPQLSAHLATAIALYRGEVLAGSPHQDWLGPHRDQCRLEFIWLLDRRAALHREAGEIGQAIVVYQRLIETEPDNEGAHRALMELFDLSGHPERALHQFAACKHVLQRELDAEPSPLTQAVHDRIVAAAKRGRTPDALAVMAPIASGPRRYRAPPHAIPLIGRETALAELTHCIVSDHARLITVIGPAGLGKTRLAQTLLDQCQQHFDDGAVAVPLTALASGEQLVGHLVDVLAVPNSTDTMLTRLCQHLSRRRVLLLLDRFEHIADAANVLPMLLAAAPSLVVVVTSQVALHCAGEFVHVLPSLLATPSAAVQLFCSVVLVRGGVIDQPADLAIVQTICERLGGNPLAIELAAGQWHVMSLPQILSELDRPLDMLTNPARDAEGPQRSVRDAVAWSFGLLHADAKALLRMLAVFESHFSADDATRALAPFMSAKRLHFHFAVLVERHLIAISGDRVVLDATPRYLLLDSIKQFAGEQLAIANQGAQVRQAHAVHFAEEARLLFEMVRAGRNRDAILAFRHRHPDLQAAGAWRSQNGEPIHRLVLAYHHSALAQLSGMADEAIAVLGAVVESHFQATPEERKLSAWCAYRLARAYAWQTNRKPAVHAVRAARAFARDCGDALLEDKILMQRAVERVHQGRHRAALLHLDRLIEKHAAADDTHRLVSTYCLRSSIHNIIGNPRAAVASGLAARDRALLSGSPQLLGFALGKLAEATVRAGDADGAQAYLREGRLVPENAFSVLRLMHMRILESGVDFECLEFEAARQRLRATLFNVHGPDRLGQKLFIQLLLDWIAVELGEVDKVTALDRVDLRLLPRSADLTDLIMRLACHRIRLFGLRKQWRKVLESFLQMVSMLQRSPNSVWRAALYEACAQALMQRGDSYTARALLAHSRSALAAAGAEPTPRQTRSWQALEATIARGADCGAVLATAPTAWRVEDPKSIIQLQNCMAEAFGDDLAFVTEQRPVALAY
jgi:predicted ATPase/DNA-binding SARP family transcriptional activator